jgi:ribosome assembly protein YihI (activator of Der GTPase)
METNSWLDPRIGRIIDLELEITEALSKGHKSHDEDKFKEHRAELEKLRAELKLERRAQGRG